MKCPDCSSEIAQADVNVEKDILLCRECNRFYSISSDVLGSKDQGRAFAAAYDLENFDIQNTPNGAWIREEGGGDIVVGGSMRSCMAYFFLFFTLIWDIATLAIVFSIFEETGGDEEMWIFLAAFGSSALVITTITVFMLMGKAEVRISKMASEVFVGALSLGWRKSFDWSEVSSIYEDWSNVTVNNRRKKHIVIEKSDSKRITFGSVLADEKRLYIFKTLLKYRALFQKKSL